MDETANRLDVSQHQLQQSPPVYTTAVGKSDMEDDLMYEIGRLRAEITRLEKDVQIKTLEAKVTHLEAENDRFVAELERMRICNGQSIAEIVSESKHRKDLIDELIDANEELRQSILCIKHARKVV